VNDSVNSSKNLLICLARLAILQHETVDRLALQEAVETAVSTQQDQPREQLKAVTQCLQVRTPRWLNAPDAALMPALICGPQGQWGILRGRNSQNQWISEWWDASSHSWREQADEALVDTIIAIVRLSKPYIASASPIYQLVRHEVFSQGKVIRDTVLGGIVINTVAMAASFYSMQVYDRVIPTGSLQTLLVLTLGIILATLFELVARHVRSSLYERLIDQVDQRLARIVYTRFLSIRLDQMPHSVGSLAGQMRGYETVRGFFTSATTNFLVDAPFALIFSIVIVLIAGWLAVFPLIFFFLSIGIGLYYRQRVEVCTEKSVNSSNYKMGLLVETVEGAETIKSGQGGWRMLSRWMETTDEARGNELQARRIGEHSQHLTSTFQQFSYVLLVTFGALLVSRGELTMGGLVAASILSGRVLAPVSMIPNQLLQWAHTKAALQGLDRLWALQDDHHGQEHPIVLETIRGHYRLESVVAYYRNIRALSVPDLSIQPGEKVGVLGRVGAGKTTFLRLLSGMYKPQEGRILLDDIDLAHIAKPNLAEHTGYVQQDGRLFSGTLRDNLVLGLLDPGDAAILQAARETGLMENVIMPHPKGLQQQIQEGGMGLSGGQRQLVNLTRAFLRKPRIWLLDEPTASMDRNLEQQITETFRQTLKPEDTLVLVTHKAEMLELVDRLIVIDNHQIVLDGPKEQVLKKLRTSS